MYRIHYVCSRTSDDEVDDIVILTFVHCYLLSLTVILVVYFNFCYFGTINYYELLKISRKLGIFPLNYQNMKL